MKKKLQKDEDNNTLRSIAKFGNIAFQFAILIVAGLYLGNLADKYFDNSKPVLAAVFSILGLILAFYMTIKNLNNEN